MKRSLFFLPIFFLLLPAAASASIFTLSYPQSRGPIPTRAQNPLFLQFLGDPIEETKILEKKRWDISVETTFSNLFERNVKTTGTGIDLDMEIQRTAVEVRYTILHHQEIGMEIPFLSFSAGFLDPFIEGYHTAFGFPNAGRNLVDQNRFSYQITEDGAVIYQADQSIFSLSDLVLWHKIKIRDESAGFPAIAAKTSLKIPTGSATEATGSGHVDFGFSLLADKRIGRFTSTTQAGFLVLGGHETLEPILKKGSVVFGQAFEFNLFQSLSLLGQITGNSPLFKNVDISQLTQPVLDLTFGLRGEILAGKKSSGVPRVRPVRAIRYLVGFSEDPLPDGPSVDFSLIFRLGTEF